MAAVARGGVSAPESTKERAGEDEELSTNPFWDLFGWKTTGEVDRR